MNYIREAIEYLKNYQNLKIAAENLRDRLHELNEELQGYKEINVTDMPGGSAKTPDDAVCNLIFQRDRTKEQYIETVNAITKIEKILNNLEDKEKKILNLSYIMDIPDSNIANYELHCSRITVQRIKKEALRKLAVQLFGIKAI